VTDSPCFYDNRSRVFEAVGDRATLEDGRVIARADIERVFAFAASRQRCEAMPGWAELDRLYSPAVIGDLAAQN